MVAACTNPAALAGGSGELHSYLEITVHGDPADPRTDDIIGDIGIGPNVAANWGLHRVDANLTMGNLLDIVGQQAKAATPWMCMP